MLRCLAVDDEPLALDLLEDNISKVPFLELVTTCRNGFEAIDALSKNPIDLIFLDIQMPGLTGIQFLNTLQATRPMVVFITAYEKFALEGYNLNVLDYLLKPVAFERFYKACQKAKELHELKTLQSAHENIDKNGILSTSTEGSNPEDFFFVNANYGHVKIVISDISHIESMRDYLKIYSTTQLKPVITRMTLKTMEEKLAGYAFLRVHKSFIVSVAKIDSIQTKLIIIGKNKIPVSDSYKDSLTDLIK
jgi:two-component system, LytTR family, response regulator